jgi:hypothetical protein
VADNQRKAAPSDRQYADRPAAEQEEHTRREIISARPERYPCFSVMHSPLGRCAARNTQWNVYVQNHSRC